MATQVRQRRGTTAQHSTFTGAQAETTVDTDKKTLVVHDGSTAGGFPLARAGSNGDITALTALASINGGPLSGMRNRIINGDMRIDQRNAGSSVTASGVYAVDRFQQYHTGTPVFSGQRSTTAPSGFANSILYQVTSAGSPAAGDLNGVLHNIEGVNVADLDFGKATAKSITLSFQVRSSITGTYSLRVTNSAGNRSYVATYTINVANTFETKTITIAGDISGTWTTDNTTGIGLWFDLGSGSTFNAAAAGVWGAGNLTRTAATSSWITNAAATFYITGVQLEVGSVATPFEVREYGDELRRCQRYYQQAPFPLLSQYFTGASAIYTGFPNIVTMRATPTQTIITAPTYVNGSSVTGNSVTNATNSSWQWTSAGAGVSQIYNGLYGLIAEL